MTPKQLTSFMAKVAVSEGCWEWRGYRHPSGYGYVNHGNQPTTAHRRAYEHFVAPVARGMHVDHLCRNRGCVNPAHLEAVTPHENALRGERATRNHCDAGHEYTPENLYVHPNGSRRCRLCKAAYDTNYRAQLRERHEAASLFVRPRPAVTALCKRCGTTNSDVQLGDVTVSKNGVAHFADGLGVTHCGSDATGYGWWWPA